MVFVVPVFLVIVTVEVEAELGIKFVIRDAHPLTFPSRIRLTSSFS